MFSVFEGLLTHTFTSGVSVFLTGRRGVIVDRIPEDAPQDWTTGPPQEPGKWGVYLVNESAWRGWNCHGPYAVATAKDPEGAAAVAGSFFRQRVGEWQSVSSLDELRAAIAAAGGQ